MVTLEIALIFSIVLFIAILIGLFFAIKHLLRYYAKLKRKD